MAPMSPQVRLSRYARLLFDAPRDKLADMITIRGSTGMWVLGVLGDKEAVVRLRVHARLPNHVCPMFLSSSCIGAPPVCLSPFLWVSHHPSISYRLCLCLWFCAFDSLTGERCALSHLCALCLTLDQRLHVFPRVFSVFLKTFSMHDALLFIDRRLSLFRSCWFCFVLSTNTVAFVSAYLSISRFVFYTSYAHTYLDVTLFVILLLSIHPALRALLRRHNTVKLGYHKKVAGTGGVALGEALTGG